eukprot:3066819-Rhodomonas_salina.3
MPVPDTAQLTKQQQVAPRACTAPDSAHDLLNRYHTLGQADLYRCALLRPAGVFGTWGLTWASEHLGHEGGVGRGRKSQIWRKGSGLRMVASEDLERAIALGENKCVCMYYRQYE